MTEEELLRRHPKVWHMAADGLWPAIKANGLLSVSKLLDLYRVAGAGRDAIESARRPQCVELDDPALGRAVIRDNKPMFEKSLAKCLLDGLTPAQWYRTLNSKSFFWVERERLIRLLAARAYAKDPQTVIEIDSAKLLEAHRDQIRLCSINSGQTLYVPQKRGNDTFKSIQAFPDGEGKIGTKDRPNIVELVVEGGVPDVAGLVVRVDRVDQGSWTKLQS